MLASTQIYMYGCFTPNHTSKGAGKLVTEMRDHITDIAITSARNNIF